MKKHHICAAGLLASSALFGCGSDTSGTGGGGASPGGAIDITISGEVLALGGYTFPPPNADEPAFVDGWEVTFKHLIVTVDAITFSEDPDVNPGDQAQHGKLVAQVDGPFAVDLHAGGPLPGKGGTDEQAVLLTTIDKQNKNGDAPFAADTRYAFGFDVVPASASAKLVNLDADAKADYEMMKQKGYTTLYVGTATWKDASCTPADPVFDTYPKTVEFKLGFTAPTTYVNCQNPDNDPAKPLGADEHQRGVIVKANQAVTAQVTIHTDHPFWDSMVHDAAPHFDMIAAQFIGATGTPVALIDDLAGIDPTAITDKNKMPVPWRTCVSTFTPPSSGQMGFDTGGLPVNPTGSPTSSVRDLRDFMTYNLSTQGHLNADGLCAVKRQYPSPP